MRFVIKWGSYGYVVDLRSRKPFTQNINEAKSWKTRANAERFLQRKDPRWASQCTIEEVM